jgi:hypothetical protein
VLAVLACTIAFAASASAASSTSSYTWPSSEKWAFIDDWADNLDYGYRWPNLYAGCLQKAAAKMYPSYAAMIRANDASFNRYVKSAAVGHCMAVYGDKYWD